MRFQENLKFRCSVLVAFLKIIALALFKKVDWTILKVALQCIDFQVFRYFGTLVIRGLAFGIIA